MEGPQPKLIRGAVWALIAYVGLVVLAHGAGFAAVLVGRMVGDDPRSDAIGVENFRRVDGSVWAGAQPARDGYERLADEGVTLVVDLRTGARDDPRVAEPDRLAELGLRHVSLSIPDGHVPSARQVNELLDLVEGADGVVFVHCGGGVGRTSAATSAYQRAQGRAPSLADHLAIGPHTLEQAWYVATGDSNVVVRRISEVLDAPRRGWSRLRALF